VNICVKTIGFPDLKKNWGSNEITVGLEGRTFGDLLQNLKLAYGDAIQKALLNEKRAVHGSVQVLRNERKWIPRGDLSFSLQDGDEVSFLLMVAGG